MKKVVAGIDIGGTFTKLGIIDRSGKIYAEDAIQTDSYLDIASYIDKLGSTIRTLLEESGEVDIQGIGIGAPNANYYKGTIEHAPNLNWKGVIHFADMLKKDLDVPVVMTNDANAAALGEMMYGSAKNMRDFIVVTLGTGLGSGIVVNGGVVYGHDGFAGEMGHLTIVDNGRQCGCGRKGCLEAYASATGLKRTVSELLAKEDEESVLNKTKPENLTAKDISVAAEQGDQIALKAFEITGKMLGESLADVVALFSPEAIFLFGGLANAGELIFRPTKVYMEKKLMPIFRDKVKILPSGLTLANAAVMGASGLIWKEIID
jgi:glucokinase